MKRAFIFFILSFCFATTVFSETIRFDIDRISFPISPKLFKDGSITDIGLGYKYSEKTSGGLRFRSTLISKNEELQDVSDSLNAINEKIYEFFLLPVE